MIESRAFLKSIWTLTFVTRSVEIKLQQLVVNFADFLKIVIFTLSCTYGMLQKWVLYYWGMDVKMFN